MSYVGGIEAGGTKFVCAVGSNPDDLEMAEIPTTTPEETIHRTVAFFKARKPVSSIGIGSFGPIDPNPSSPTYGYITATPKLGWRNFNFAGAIRESLGVKVAFDTDVNAAALGEYRWGAAQGLHTFLYVTVGTGIGGGCMVDGRLLHGKTHPEMGHVFVPHDRQLDPFTGACPYHTDCLEAMACGTAIRERWGQPAELLPANHPAWELEAHYLAFGMATWICTLSPQKIVAGGGIFHHAELYPMIQAKVVALVNGYLDVPEIVPPLLGARAGVLGAIALAL